MSFGAMVVVVRDAVRVPGLRSTTSYLLLLAVKILQPT